MKVEEILDAWSEDCEIDAKDLVEESVRAVRLHAKYYRMYVHERLRSSKLEEERNLLLNLKHEYYMGALDSETLAERGWPPFQRTLMKGDVERHMRADPDVQDANLRCALQREKAEALREIIKSIGQRTFHIKNMIEFRKFQGGEY